MTDMASPQHSVFNFTSTTGYIVTHPQKLFAIGHTASISSWSDPNVHLHTHSEELYFLRQGRLQFQIQDFQLSLHPNEMLMVKAGVPHAVLGGTGRIEHFGIRAPALNDKLVVGELEKDLPTASEDTRLVSRTWGHRIPLDLPQHKNCWLIGSGAALYESQHLILAYLDFPTAEAANAGIGTRHQLHSHRRSLEYYTVLQGSKTLQIEEELLTIRPGEILVVPPDVKHTLHSRRAPFLGFTIRVPVELDDKITVES